MLRWASQEDHVYYNQMRTMLHATYQLLVEWGNTIYLKTRLKRGTGTFLSDL